jgi:Protein of unknown function (DUF1566)
VAIDILEDKMKKLILIVLFGFFAIAATAGCPNWPTANRYSFNANGSEVTDQRTGLVWARCNAGQTWSGSTCINSASTFTHAGALQYAATQAGWRLPNKRELFSLADKSCSNPAIDSVAFPTTPSAFFWTSSTLVGNSDDAWFVYFGDGYVGSSGRYNSYHVRLVRISQ